MNRTLLETRLIFHSRLAAGALAFLLLMTSLAAWSGFQSVNAHNEALSRIEQAHNEELASVMRKYEHGGDAGYVAYYTQHLTWSAPGPLAFAAFGNRDLQPFSLRVRLLGLHSQLYESETVNPELALPGHFDFAFVLVYLVPLVVISLMHDLLTSERESGRLRLIASMPVARSALWLQRAALRFGYVASCALLPFLVTGAISGANMADLAGVTAIALSYIACWFGLSLVISAIARSSAVSAATLLGCFVVLTLVLPTVANALITRAVPVAKGVELMLAQRQEVHQGWDLPKAVTFEKFFRTHPEWSSTPPVRERFHWKWYYAMHQAGDDAVAPQATLYRQSLLGRESWTRLAAIFLPSVGAQVALHRVANTDLEGQLAYMDQVEQFHKRLRHYYYPFLFHERPFGKDAFEALPTFQPAPESGTFLWSVLLTLGLASLASLCAGAALLRRIEV